MTTGFEDGLYLDRCYLACPEELRDEVAVFRGVCLTAHSPWDRGKSAVKSDGSYTVPVDSEAVRKSLYGLWLVACYEHYRDRQDWRACVTTAVDIGKCVADVISRRDRHVIAAGLRVTAGARKPRARQPKHDDTAILFEYQRVRGGCGTEKEAYKAVSEAIDTQPSVRYVQGVVNNAQRNP